MNPVAAIIRRHLLGGRSVDVPDIGTIAVDRKAARKIHGEMRLSVPVKELVITQDRGAVSIMDYMIQELGVDHAQATMLYDDWLQNATGDGSITIDGVGTFDINAGTIGLLSEFIELLNPIPDDKVVLTTNAATKPIQLVPGRKSGTVWLVLAIVVVSVALLYLIYYFSDDLLKVLTNLCH